MDIFKPLKNKIERINQFKNLSGLETILTHILRAEYYYKKGIENKDEHLFTDVIYRTNQAFEGCSRQAYMILANKSEEQTQKKKAYQIENYFSQNNILNERVLPQFETYRNKWRKEAAHNFKLFFDESEAYFAILNVSTYAYVLFNQILEKLAFDTESNKIESNQKEKNQIKKIVENQNETLIKRIGKVINHFSKGNNLLNFETGLSEIETNAMLSSYIQNSSKTIQTKIEARLSPSNFLRADMVIEDDKEKLIIELKRFYRPQMLKAYIEQLLKYLELADITQGILYFTSTSADEPNFSLETREIVRDNKTYTIDIIKT